VNLDTYLLECEALVGRAEGIQVGMLSRNVLLSVWNTSADVRGMGFCKRTDESKCGRGRTHRGGMRRNDQDSMT